MSPHHSRPLLKPLPGRLLSIIISIGSLIVLWASVLNHQAPSHGVAVLLLITTGFSAFHAIGWRPRYQFERYVLSPIGSLVLVAIIAYYHFSLLA